MRCAASADLRRVQRGAAGARAAPAGRCRTKKPTAFTAAVVSRLKAEHDASFFARVRRMFDDMHLVYAGVGAAAATAVCVVIMLSMLRFATIDRPDSLPDRARCCDAARLRRPDRLWMRWRHAASGWAEAFSAPTRRQSRTPCSRSTRGDPPRALVQPATPCSPRGRNRRSQAEVIEELLDAVVPGPRRLNRRTSNSEMVGWSPARPSAPASMRRSICQLPAGKKRADRTADPAGPEPAAPSPSARRV